VGPHVGQLAMTLHVADVVRAIRRIQALLTSRGRNVLVRGTQDDRTLAQRPNGGPLDYAPDEVTPNATNPPPNLARSTRASHMGTATDPMTFARSPLGASWRRSKRLW